MNSRRFLRHSRFVAAAYITAALAILLSPATSSELPSRFLWKASAPLIAAQTVDGDRKHALKDPSVVFHEGRWHLFCTVRGMKRSHGIVYLSFTDWAKAAEAKQTMLTNHDGFFCAPQVFYFRPQRQWYLICQAADKNWKPEYGPAYAVSSRIDDPSGWSKLTPLPIAKPADAAGWLDFWVICDNRWAYLFFTSLDGKMWRSRTALEKFPQGWSDPVLALQDDIFEASHTYKLVGEDRYLTVVEAQNGHGWRYYKAYTADKLDGAWKPLAATRDETFASMRNVRQTIRWTDSISHGELLRAGVDERLEVDPRQLRFVFQGVLDKERAGLQYGEIPWRIGLLEPLNEP